MADDIDVDNMLEDFLEAPESKLDIKENDFYFSTSLLINDVIRKINDDFITSLERFMTNFFTHESSK